MDSNDALSAKEKKVECIRKVLQELDRLILMEERRSSAFSSRSRE